ncbi:hypothetical protein BBK82_02550 [Lentzea guizhouensis]|uniref:Lipocalin-like domain-containing protein n=1 Tax=Lentzea guizhouensis TaxID=1586287 RepID=A0A1B2HBL1_9PSEU|nr:hypothetical protein BBK82_02550 [Lentzea guizhouensis]
MEIAGQWRVRVGRPGGETESELDFAEDGTATLVKGGRGSGTWTATGAGTFSYRITEEMTDPAGTVEINQDAVLNGDAFVSSGITTVRLADGSTIREAHVRITALRRT